MGSSNSLAIATNALHLFTDLLTFIISLIAIWVAGLPTSQRMSFGWHRAEILGSFVSILITWGLTGILVYMAGVRVIFFFSEVKMDPLWMLITFIYGIVINIIMVFLRHNGHSHGDGDAEQGQRDGKENINVTAAVITLNS